MTDKTERAQEALDSSVQENKSRYWRPVAQKLAEDVLALNAELEIANRERDFQFEHGFQWRNRAQQAEAELAGLKDGGYRTERVIFRLIQCPCCGHLLCWVNPRLPNYCPECGKNIIAKLGGCILLTDYDATLKVKG